MIKVNNIIIKPTIFPDGTSQVWKLDEEILIAKEFHIEFNFENEAEVFQLQQLNHLLKYGRVPRQTTLHMPFLPYGRQDKQISNDATFALTIFASIINNMRFNKVTTLDVHSSVAFDLFDNLDNIHPNAEIRLAHNSISNFETDSYKTVIAYPDKGAADRYHFKQNFSIVGDKNRNQLTGFIESYSIKGVNPKGKDVLIVDDICDGGMTFRLLSRELYKQGADSVSLYVTHGIFSKGLDVLRADGITRIFTKDGEIK